MIRVIATFHLRAENQQNAIELAKELVETTRAEDGCAMYDLLQPVDDASQMLILEAWKSQKALDRHSASEHFTRLVPMLAGLCVQPPSVIEYIQVM